LCSKEEKKNDTVDFKVCPNDAYNSSPLIPEHKYLCRSQIGLDVLNGAGNSLQYK